MKIHLLLNGEMKLVRPKVFTHYLRERNLLLFTFAFSRSLMDINMYVAERGNPVQLFSIKTYVCCAVSDSLIRYYRLKLYFFKRT